MQLFAEGTATLENEFSELKQLEDAANAKSKCPPPPTPDPPPPDFSQADNFMVIWETFMATEKAARNEELAKETTARNEELAAHLAARTKEESARHERLVKDDIPRRERHEVFFKELVALQTDMRRTHDELKQSHSDLHRTLDDTIGTKVTAHFELELENHIDVTIDGKVKALVNAEVEQRGLCTDETVDTKLRPGLRRPPKGVGAN